MIRPLPNDLMEAFAKLAETGAAVGDKPYVVGGFIRDWLYGLPIEEVNDFDIITEFGKTDVFVDDLCNRFGLGEPIQYDYSKTKRLIINNYIFEFQSADNPNVHFPIENDLIQMDIEPNYFNKNIFERDFTIDCICYDIMEHSVIDLTGGVEDLLINGLIKTPIKAVKAIGYNPLIILRAIRLALEFKLSPDKEFKEAIPFGIQLLPGAVEKRSEKFVQGMIRDIFDYNPEDAEKIFRFYGLYEILPMPSELMDQKVKSDMGIVYQANSEDDMLSIEVNDNDKVLKLGFTSYDVLEESNKVALHKAISDLYLDGVITKEYNIKLLGEKTPTCNVENILKLNEASIEKDWYRTAQANIHLYDRHQRRQEYRNRKRREQKRDRIGKIKSWRDFMNKFQGGIR